MTKTRLTCVVVLLFLGLLSGCSKPLSDAEMKAAAKRQADALGGAYLAKDYTKLVDLMYPKAVAGMGGRDKVTAAMRAADQDADAKGFPMRSVRMGEPEQLMSSGVEHYVIVRESLEMAAPGGVLRSEGYVLGISDDGGRTWTFVDGAGIPEERDKVKRILPNLPDTLRLPAKQPAQFEAAK